MPSVGFEPTCFRACSLGKCVYQFHHDGIKRGSGESDPHGESLRLPVFGTGAVPVEPDPQILMTGFEPIRIVPVGFEPAASAISPHQHFIARAENRTLQVCSASPCPNNELFLWTRFLHAIAYIPLLPTRFPFRHRANDPIGDRTRVYAVRGRRLNRLTMGPGVTTGNRTPMSRSTICRSTIELWPQ